MANLKFLIGAACFLSASAHALYVTPSVPENFKTIGGVGHLSISPSDTSFANGIRSKIAGGAARVALAGGGADIPVAYKFALNAGKAAASMAFGWPAAFLIAGGLAYQYFTDAGFTVEGGKWVKKSTTTPLEFWAQGLAYTTPRYPSREAALADWVAYIEGSGWGELTLHHIDFGTKYSYERLRPGATIKECCISADTYQQSLTPTTITTPVQLPEFETTMEPRPVPLGAPQVWPSVAPMWWPVQNPILSPSPVNPADPQAVPVPTPLRVPQGDPVPVIPATDPATWKSPVVDIIPSPTPDNPWRVDVQPKDITTTSPEPLAPDVVTPTDPAGEPTQEQLDLCALHPEILACADLDEVDPEELESRDVSISVSPDSGWGSGAGSCPAPKVITVQGRQIPIPLDLVCQFMSGIRPIIIALAWLSAGFILIGARGGD